MKKVVIFSWLGLLAMLIIGAAGCERETRVADPVRFATLVTPDGSGSYPTIQEAVDAASDGDVIELADGLFSGPGNRDIDFLGKAITIRSRSGKPSLCVIDCQGTPEDPHRGFIFRNQEDRDSVLEGIGITNGYVANIDEEFGLGGGVLCLYTSRPTLRNLAIVGNRATGGGGLGCFARSSPLVTDCLFEDNHATVAGGAVMISEESSPELKRVLFRGNSATERGGAVFASAKSQPVFSDCRFEENLAEFGGAVAGTGFTLEDCRLVDNHAYDDGGAVAAAGSTVITNCIMSGNRAETAGGGVHFQGRNHVANCTLAGNRAGRNGSGLSLARNANVTIDRTIVVFGKNRKGVFVHPEARVVISCSNIFGNEGGDWAEGIDGLEGLDGNMCADPLFCPATVHGPGYCSLRGDSPCLATACGPMGAVGVGCCTDVTHVP